MKRNEWGVEYTGAKLAVAANEKASYHSQRVLVWQQKKEDVIAEIRSDGMQINESIVDEMRKLGNYTTSNIGDGPSVTIRHDLLERLGEAHSKVVRHEKLVKEYDAWLQMMNAHNDHRFFLQHDDWLYFFGR